MQQVVGSEFKNAIFYNYLKKMKNIHDFILQFNLTFKTSGFIEIARNRWFSIIGGQFHFRDIGSLVTK